MSLFNKQKESKSQEQMREIDNQKLYDKIKENKRQEEEKQKLAAQALSSRRVVLNNLNTSSTSPNSPTVSVSNSNSPNSLGNVSYNANLLGASNNGLNLVGQWTPNQINPYNPHNNVQTINTYPVMPSNMASIKKDEFAEVLDGLFTHQEKAEYLTSVGYEVMTGGTLAAKPTANGEHPAGDGLFLYQSIDTLFIKEISIKFKNMLLAKPVLKIKL